MRLSTPLVGQGMRLRLDTVVRDEEYIAALDNKQWSWKRRELPWTMNNGVGQ